MICINKFKYISLYSIVLKILMSIRFIGYESYVPASPGNYSKGKTKVIRFSTQPDQQQQKAQKVNRYRQQLDKQVEQMRKRKQAQKDRQHLQDQKRQKQFYQSLQHAKRVQNQSPRNVRNFHFNQHQHKSNVKKGYNNPEEVNRFDLSQDNYLFESRLAQIGKKKFQLDIPVFQSKSDLIFQQDDFSAEKRRRDMIDEMDRNLSGAHMAIQRSKGSVIVDQQLERLKRRLKTQGNGVMSENDADNMYNLPYKNYLYNSPYRYRHKREASWM